MEVYSDYEMGVGKCFNVQIKSSIIFKQRNIKSSHMKTRGFIEINNPNVLGFLADILQFEYNVPIKFSKDIVKDALMPFILALRDDLSIYIETKYVDKVYRDSYYKYYATKASEYSRDCIKLSLFDNATKKFSSGILPFDIADEVSDSYLGFIVLRPTFPKIIGRSAVSPKAFKNNDFVSCLTNIETSVDGYKVKVESFPSSSQDAESITCAETTLWALMEYYGNKYPEHTPIKPSDVVKVLRSRIAGRQLPSVGLNVDCLTYAIKMFGFEPRLYHRMAFGSLNNILACYIESGIPMVVALSNEECITGNKSSRQIRHALLCIGHENIKPTMVELAASSAVKKLDNVKGKIDVLDYDDIEKRFLFIDDNFPPYQYDALETPALRYKNLDWGACRIACIIAPLHDKVFMEPFMVKEYVFNLLKSIYFSHYCGNTITTRTYLCSTRSYVNYVKSSAMSDAMKDEISKLYMPKFIWVTEISDLDGLKQQCVKSLVLLDATARQLRYFAPCLAVFTNGKCYRKVSEKNILHTLDININPFNSYSNLR